MHVPRLPRCLLLLAFLVPRVLGAADLVVADGASLEVDIRATGHPFTARLEHFDVTLAGDLAPPTIDRATLRFRWQELKTGKADRDAAMLKWVGADRNPEGNFVLESFQPASDPGVFTGSGKLELAGQSRPVSFPVRLETRDGVTTLRGEASIDHQQWGLPKIRKFGVFTVNPVVKVRFAVPVRTRP